MKSGSAEGKRWCIRAKISHDDVNKALRDPVIYRCNLTDHHRTGSRWKVYPTYDFCVPFVDALEGITLALRTTEYNDRNAQYAWIQNAMGARKVPVWEFSRLSFIRTVLSKHKLAQIVGSGIVTGWDDPRMPTIRGILRRGMTVDALREFIRDQGPSRNVVSMDWTIIWAINKKHIDPVAPRFTAVRQASIVSARITGASGIVTEDRPRHVKNPAVGLKKVTYSSDIWLDQDDAKTFVVAEEITLMGWGNAIIRRIHLDEGDSNVKEVELDLHLAGDFKLTKKKVTWLSKDQALSPVRLHDFGYLIKKDKLEKDDDILENLNQHSETVEDAWADSNVAGLRRGEIIQFERYGYYRIDQVAIGGEPAHCFKIPTGKD
ncbi:hypothetical protein CAC42_1712 [Sphaceloma murrayae]|uniref:Glutamyl/glutaminyl-tRNA synthetase class Ib anti-codon binding domain-containing protein n=1 Tax=Sphaceloma murrayae TaxID=2082308 RepID=A0A2K1QIG5_9PEZI|nr:hypothetical protein CAC42_1712 [Sphaceloma murrayae]